MKPGAVIVDIAVDQGGCVETIHETTHADPVYERHGVLHYGVGNVPAAVPHTSTYAQQYVDEARPPPATTTGLAMPCREGQAFCG